MNDDGAKALDVRVVGIGQCGRCRQEDAAEAERKKLGIQLEPHFMPQGIVNFDKP